MITWKILGYAGLLPFIGCITLNAYIDDLGFDSQKVFIAYSAIILSFIAGSLWQVTENEKYKTPQLISNIFSLIAFCALCINHLEGLIILASSYPLILYYEYKIYLRLPQQQTYRKMRCNLTGLVFILHIVGIYIWYI
jgi:hypothetical protein